MIRRAFTLLEALLVILVLGLIASMVFPNLGHELRNRSLIESADRLRSLIVTTHARAVFEGVSYRIQFPGTPDPNDPKVRKEIDTPLETYQPQILKQWNALQYPDEYAEVESPLGDAAILQPGTRCVAVLSGRPDFTIAGSSPIAGPQVGEGLASFVPLTVNPDGTAEWVTFVLTDLPYDVQLEREDAAHILNVIVDGRTGQVWVQRALRREEVELMNEKGASPILHVDFTAGEEITEDNLLEIHMRAVGSSGGSAGGGSGGGASAGAQGR
jgi:type II secretory pathway pseudopilin PulG